MVTFPWFSFYAENWITSCAIAHMNCAQEGAYIRLLAYAWIDKQCSLPRETEALKRLARWRGREKGFEVVEECFSIHPDDHTRYTNAKLYEEWKKANRLSGIRRKAGQTRHQKPAVEVPVRKIQDRSGKGFTKVSSEILAVADKHFPPI